MSKDTGRVVHGLFPVEGDAEAPEVYTLTIVRLLDGGRTQTYPLPVLAEECPDTAALYALMGGGVFDVQGKSEKGRIVARRKYEFDGPPKPLPAVPGQAAAPAAQVQPVQQQQPAQQQQPGGIDLAAIIVALISTSAQTQAQMFTAMSTMVAALAGKSSGDQTQLVPLVQALLAAKTGGGGGLKVEDVFKLLGKGAEIAADKLGDDEAQSPEETLQGLATLIGGVGKIAELGKQPGQNAPGIPNGQ